MRVLGGSRFSVVVARRDSLTHLDGVTTFTVNLAKGFLRLGRRVALMSWGLLRPPSPYKSFEEYLAEVHGLAGVDVLTIAGRGLGSHPEPRVSLGWLLRGPRVLRSWGADALILSGVVPTTFRPRIAVMHNVTVLGSRAGRWLYRRLYASYDAVVCVSEKSREEAEGAGVDCDYVIYNPVDLEPYRPRPYESRERLLVHVGTRGEKNLQISLAAVELLRREGLDVRLAVFGTGGRELVKSAYGGVPGWVEVYDYAPVGVKAEVLSRAAALLLPSSHEAFSYAAVEAMASGTPPVVSEAVPPEVVVDGYNGVRVGELSPRAFAEAVKALLTDEGLWRRLSRNGVEFARRFDAAEVARRYEEVIRKLA